jgi:hypothetical protein
MDLRAIGLKCVEWIHLAQDKDQWWAIMNMVTDFQLPIRGGEFFDLLIDLTSQE